MQEVLVQYLGLQIPWRSEWQSTPIFFPDKSHGQRSLTDDSTWGCKSRTQFSNKTTIRWASSARRDKRASWTPGGCFLCVWVQGKEKKRLSGNIWWKIKQHPFNPQLPGCPCYNYMPSDWKATRCSGPKPGITHLATILVYKRSGQKDRTAFKLKKMEAFFRLAHWKNGGKLEH